MQLILLLQVCLFGLSSASLGTRFLMMFPPHNGPVANVTHRITVTAAGAWTSVTVKILESDFLQQIFLSANQSRTIHLPLSVGMTSARSSHLLSVESARPVSALASFCAQNGCDHSRLHDVSSWETLYYPVTPDFPDQTSISQMVITGSDHETSVHVLLSGEVVYEGNLYSKGSILNVHIGALESIYLQGNTSFSGSEIHSEEDICVVVGFTCSKPTTGNCSYGFAELKPVSQWGFDYVIPPLVNTGVSSSFLLAMATTNSMLDVGVGTSRKNVPVVGGVMKVIPVVNTDKIHITSDNPLQLVYFRREDGERVSALVALPSVYDVCQALPVFDSADVNEQFENGADTDDLRSVAELSQRPNSTQPPDDADVGHYLSTLNRQSYPAVCQKNEGSCEELQCGHNRNCIIENGKPLCSMKMRICTAWGDSYYRTFDGRAFVLQGDCNYTIVQTTCPGSNASVPLQINIARAYLKGVTLSVIHTVQISIQGFNISMVKSDFNHVRIDGQKRNLPLTLANGSLNLYPSGSGVVLDTNFGLFLHYDWNHHLQVGVGPELYGSLCGLCGNANHSSSDAFTAAYTLPWIVDSNGDRCNEDCVSDSSSPVCAISQTRSPGVNQDSAETVCALLQRSDGPFAECHLLIDPEPYVRSCMSNQCVSAAASCMCRVLTVYANMCQRLGGRVVYWRRTAKCPMLCPMNSHYETCGSACPATCADPDAQLNCSLPCVESCQCNRGYLLSGGKCVPQNKCGCMHQGSYYLPKENFWIDERCRERCVCQPASKAVMCTRSHCQAGEVCKVQNGVVGCRVDEPGVCIAKGHPHYTTFDGHNFDFLGNCTYLFTAHCPTWGGLEDFSVEVQNQRKDATNVSIRHVKVSVSGYFIEMSKEWKNMVMVNGLLLRLPSVLSQGKVNLYMTGLSKSLETDFGVVVIYNSDILTVRMPRVYADALCGLCGNFNGDPEDDLIAEDPSDVSPAVRRWRTSSAHGCVDVPLDRSGRFSQDMALYQGEDFCGRLLDMEGAFQSCHKTVDPQVFFDNCVYDLSYSNGNQTSLCQILSSYVAICQEMGAIVDEWRASNFCSLSCPSRSEYSLCGKPTSVCAANPSPVKEKCKEGCFCISGFFQSGGECVADSDCGCIYSGVYHEIQESFYPDEHCRLRCVCVGHSQVQCSDHTCPNGTKCAVQDGQRECRVVQPVKCTVMGGRHVRRYDGHNFDFNMGSCLYVLSQACEKEQSDPVILIQHGRLYLRAHGVNLTLEVENFGKVKIEDVLWRLPAHFEHIAMLHSGSLTRVVFVDTGIVVTYGGPDLIQIVVPASYGKMCGLCGNINAINTVDTHSLTGSLTSDGSIFAASWALLPSGSNCSEACGDLCSACNATTFAEFGSDNFCGVLSSLAGSFSGCHSTVDPEPFFQNCVNDMCMSNGTVALFCSRLRYYAFACQEAGAEVKSWREGKCSLVCPKNSHYNICAGACPEPCGVPNDTPCPWPCSEGCQCDFGYVWSGNGCIQAEKCGCLHHGQYHELGETFWTAGCSERCNCSAPATTLCESVTCPEGESCTLNNTWGCAGKGEELKLCQNGETCEALSEPQQTQCWVLGGSHFYTFDGEMFEFQGNCTYTLVEVLNGTHVEDSFWVRVQKDRTPDQAASLKAIHVKVAEDHIAIYRGGKGYAWINGRKMLLPITLQSGLVKIHQSGVFVVVDTHRGIQVKYDCVHIAAVLFSNDKEVHGMCGNNNGIQEDDLRTPQGEVVNATTFGWSWRVPDQETQCTADWGEACSSCSGEQLKEKNVATHWISLHEYLWSQQSPFYLCREVVNDTKISSVLNIFDLCTSPDTREAVCLMIEAYAAACQKAHIQTGEWRNATFCPMSCPLNSHYEPCGTACPATCETQHTSSPCPLACVETCQCDPGFVLDGDLCVPFSRCGCVHNGDRYHSDQLFWADEECTNRCVCDPHTHQIQCQLASCGPDEYCGLRDGVRSCLPHPWHTCMYTRGHIITFDQHDYSLQGTCQYQLLGICGQREGLAGLEVHVQTDGHLESAFHVLVNVDGVLVRLNSKNAGSVEVNGVTRNMPHLLSPAAFVSSLGLHTHIYTDLGLIFTLSVQGRITISLSKRYANATCGLCGNFNSDPADELTATGTQEHLGPEPFGKAWRSGQNPWCVEGCLGGTCPKCSPEHVARYSDPGACGIILELNGPFRHCHGKVDPYSFYKRCVSDLCLHEGLQPALCLSLSDYTAVCLFHKAAVNTWRTSGFCYQSCPSSSNYSMSSAPIHLCLGWKNNTIEMLHNMGENCICNAGLVHSGSLCVRPENCGCFHHGEYLRAAQEVSTCEQSCLCHAGGHVTCRNISCGKNEECKLIKGIHGCHPKPKGAQCSVDGSQYTTFDGQTFEFYGSCNYTLAQTCTLRNLDVEPFIITARSNLRGGRHINLQIFQMNFKMSSDFPGEVQVNGVQENLPFSQNNVTILQKNGLITIKAPQSVELISDLHHHIMVKIPDVYRQSTCGLCGNYDDNPSDDLQLPNGTVITDPAVFGPSWKRFDRSSCSDVCDSACQRCQSAMPVYTSDIYCGILTQPRGPFSSCHLLVSAQKYYSLCMTYLCIAEGQSQALCDALQAYEAACKEAGVKVDRWRNTTGCAYQCPQFSHHSPCANVCSSLCPEVSQAVQCPRDCEEGCQCDAGHLYNGNACVPTGDCGCVQDGRMFKAFESKILQNCNINCTCGPPLVCKQHSCSAQHKCAISDGIMACRKDEEIPDPCEGKCDRSEKCSLSNGLPVCESHQGVCWVWGDQHYHTFDGLDYDLKGTCTYLLAGSRGSACGLTPFSVSKKGDCCDGTGASSTRVVTVQTYGFVIKLSSEKGRVHVNGQVNYIPVRLLRGKIQVSYLDGKALLKTDFGMQVVFDWSSSVSVTVAPQYKSKVYGLCGNFNGDRLDENAVTKPGSPPFKSMVELARAYRLFDGDHNCCTDCKQTVEAVTLAADSVSGVVSSYRQLCAVLTDQKGPFAYCHSKVNADSFYRSCVADLMQGGGSKVAVDQALKSLSMVCGQFSDDHYSGVTVDVPCPPNSHYKTCGSSCPPSCEFNATFCTKDCVQGCFCDPGFIKSAEGCVPPHQCGCRDSTGKYHSLKSTFWSPDNCGQVCLCGPAAGVVHCSPDKCPRGMVCKHMQALNVCQPETPQNCTIVTGLHFTTFDGRSFEFRDTCAYSLVHTNSNVTQLAPFNITIMDAMCRKRIFNGFTIKLSVYGLEVAVSKDDPGKILVDGLHKPLPYSHQKGHVKAYRTPSSLIVHVDTGLQLILYKMGAVMIILPSVYSSSVSGLCGNANTDPHDDLMMPSGERAQNTQEFAHSWRPGGAEACRSSCSSRLKRCPEEEQRLFKGSDFCGVLLNELGPFGDCALVLSPKIYFHRCVADSCSHGGHYSALCNSIASYTAACQAAHLTIRQWRSDIFCGMSCPKNSHYELCGPRCPVVCPGLSSPENCSGGCEEGCQCDPGYVLSDDQCVLPSDCGCLHDGQYYPAGYFFSGDKCQKCNCERGRVTCHPAPCIHPESCPIKDGLAHCKPLEQGVCQVLAGFGYITFDGLTLPHYGACTYVVSDISSKTTPGYTLLLSFKEDQDKNVFKISRLVFLWLSLEVAIDPETLWSIQVDKKEHSVPFDNGEIKAYQVGSGLAITTGSGVKIELSFTQYLRLSVPQGHDGTASGLCGNFNGDKADDLQLRNNSRARSVAEFLHSWAVDDPARRCSETCGRACDKCSVSHEATIACDDLFVKTVEFSHCRSSGVELNIYIETCIAAFCAGAGHIPATCLALEAYAATCQAKGLSVGPWRKNSPCTLQCPDRSSPSECVEPSSNSCPALLRPGSSASGCSEGCQCLNGNVFDEGECVPYSQCGCILHDKYIKMDDQLYTEDCKERCWCHPLGGALCEVAACNPGQQCALRNGSLGCHGSGVCELRGSLQVSTLSGQQLSLEPQLPYRLVSLCDETDEEWFSLISYHGPCDDTSSRVVTVFHILLQGSSVTIQEGTVKVNGHFVSLPYVLRSGVSLSSAVTQDKSEVIVILRRDAGMESELEMEIGVTMVTVKLPLWYSGKLCGLCGNHNDLPLHVSVNSWILPDFPVCGLTR